MAVHSHTSGLLNGLAPNTPVAAPNLGGRLLYTRDGGLWTLNLANGNAAEVAPAPELGQVTAARWSPDGAKILYAVHEVKDRRTPISTVLIADADGSNARKV